ncbi:MAG TPA: hypothetical protein VKV21_16570 [Solirubrobacteraceae bacterium]|nr:hypothetical protein [Solirubrobacteraceae bacterium]
MSAGKMGDMGRSGPSWAAVSIDEVEAIDWRGTGIRWHPVRGALGADIVGMAAFTASRAGELVVEPHTEAADGRGQQEVYVVIRGAARFVIDGAEIEAPAGTFVRVEPEAHRQAEALTAPTAVLALGGSSTFRPSASEWIERARPHIRSDPARARAIVEELRRALPGDRGLDVGEALLALGTGDVPAARAIVTALVSELPELRGVLASDPDLGSLLLA